jgi:glycosyltransferase involved in cell wall biosynthesis
MNYTVLSVADPFSRIDRDSSDSSDFVLNVLDRHLVSCGWRSLVIAAEGSEIAGELIAAPSWEGLINDQARVAARQAHQRLVQDTLNRHRVDLVHIHAAEFQYFLPPSADIPVLTTLYKPLSTYPESCLQINRANSYLNCISAVQQGRNPSEFIPAIRCRVDAELCRYRSVKQALVVAIGRICEETRFHVALDAAKKADCAMALAGELRNDPRDLEYFEREIAPRLDERRQYLGPITVARRHDLLSHAQALLVPDFGDGTNTVVVLEAMSSGTPVIGLCSDSGANELVADGLNGFIVSSAREMATAIRRAEMLQPRDCLELAVRNGGTLAMTRAYETLYRRIRSDANVPKQHWAAVQHGTSWLADVY